MKEVYKTFFVCLASRANFHLVLDSDVTGRRNIQELAHIQIYQVYIVHCTLYKHIQKIIIQKKKAATDEPQSFKCMNKQGLQNHITIICCYSS